MKLTNITKDFKDVRAVDNLSIEIDKGQIIGFIGSNGAGKSTTINMIMESIYPSNGDITGNTDISYVTSEPSFYDNLYVKDIIKYECKLCNKINDNIDYLIEYFDLNINKKIKELSLGNKKKLALVCSFIKDSNIYILDEPTSGLDPIMQEKLFNYLLKLKNDNKCIFLSSHNLIEVEKYCDKVLIIKNGVLVKTVDLDKVKSKNIVICTYELKDGSTNKIIWKKSIKSLLNKLNSLDIIKLEIKNESVIDEFLGYYNMEENI